MLISKKRKVLFSCILLGIVSLFLGTIQASGLDLRSTAFKDKGDIPLKYTGLSYNMSPPLFWSEIPQGTRSFVLIAEDPDAPGGVWIHWVVYDIPSDIYMLRADMPIRGILPSGIKQGKNSFHTLGYGGPYPPPGPAHRYIFTLYALDVFLGLPPGEDKNTVLALMEGHVLEKTEITGYFGR